MTTSSTTDLGEPAANRSRTLRLALAMRGGVSLAVWIGGAVAELDLFRRACMLPGEPADFKLPERENARHFERALLYRRLFAMTKYNRVEIDILAGASAGGLNAVLFALAQSCGAVLDETVRRTWVERGGIWDLLRKPGFGRIPSILEGNERLFVLADEALTTLANPSETNDPRLPPKHEHTAASRLSVELAATLLDDPLDPNRKNQAGFSFVKTSAGLGSAYTTIPGDYNHDEARLAIARMAFAARSTSSFPGAFEPARVHSLASSRDAAGVMGGPTTAGPPNPTVDMSTAFLYGRDPNEPAEPYFVVDGGIFDNIPIDRAIRAIQRAPASDPTERRLVYLDPEPPVPTAPNLESTKSSVVDWVPVIRRSTALKQRTETADDELDGILRNNELVRAQQARLRLLAAEMDAFAVAASATQEVEQRLQGYLQTRIAADAQRFAALLTDPASELCRPPNRAHDYSSLDSTAALDLQSWTSDCYHSASAANWSSTTGDFANIERGEDILACLEQVRTLIGWVHALENVAVGAGAFRQQQDDGTVPALQLKDCKQRSYRCLVLLIAAKHRTIDAVLAAPLLPWKHPQPPVYEKADFTGALEASLRAQLELQLSNDVAESIQSDTGDAELYESLGHAFADKPSQIPGGWQPFVTAIRDRLQTVKEDLVNQSQEWLPPDQPDPTQDWQVEWNASIYRQFYRSALAGQSLSNLSRLLATVGGAVSSTYITYHKITSDEKPATIDVFDDLCREARAKQLEAWVRRLPKKVNSPQGPGAAYPEMAQAIARSQVHPLLADAKLAGNVMSRFGGFFRARWRENDWQWGRLDAAAGIARMLDATRGPDALGDLINPRVVGPLQESILTESQETVEDPADGRTVVTTAGADTLSTISPRYRFSLASRAAPLVYRALIPPAESGVSVQRALGLAAQIVLRLLTVPLVLVADPLRLAWALLTILGSAALLGAGGSTVMWRITSSVIFIVAAVMIAVRARQAHRNWHEVLARLASIGKSDQNLRTSEDWIPLLTDRSTRVWRVGSFAFAGVVGACAIYELIVVCFKLESCGFPVLYVPVEAFLVWAAFVFGFQHYFNQRAYQIQVTPRVTVGRKLWAVIACGAAVAVVFLAEAHAHRQPGPPKTHIINIGGIGVDWSWDRPPTTWVVAATATAVLTFLSLWGWTKIWAAVTCMVAVACVAGGLQALLDHGGGGWDLLPTVVWWVVLSVMLPVMPVRGIEDTTRSTTTGVGDDYGENERPVLLPRLSEHGDVARSA